jgi:hypothetical protein
LGYDIVFSPFAAEKPVDVGQAYLCGAPIQGSEQELFRSMGSRNSLPTSKDHFGAPEERVRFPAAMS